MQVIIYAALYHDGAPCTQTTIGSVSYVHINRADMSMMSFMQFVAKDLGLTIISFTGGRAICELDSEI